MAQSTNPRKLREVPPVAEDNVAIPAQDETPVIAPSAPSLPELDAFAAAVERWVEQPVPV